VKIIENDEFSRTPSQNPAKGQLLQIILLYAARGPQFSHPWSRS